MGLAKRLLMEQEDEERLKERWIRKKLNDPDANEYSDGWHDLADEYDEFHAHDGLGFDLDFEGYDDDWSVAGKRGIEIFDENMQASSEMLSLPLEGPSFKKMLVMLHAHVVASVEAYLSSTFIEKALSAEEFMRKLVETDPEFAKRQFTLKEIFTKQENLKNDLSKYLKDLIFHDIAKVRKMYVSVFGIDFGEIAWLYKAVALRHHCVHRAGYDKDGNEVVISKESIMDLIDKCSTLVHETDSQIISLLSVENFF